MGCRFHRVMLATGKLAVAIALLPAGCGGGGNDGSGGDKTPPRITGGGSSFVHPMMSTWADEYNEKKHVEVNYTPSGSGAGIKQMTDKTLDFGCTDGPMSDEELAKAKEVGGSVIHVPLTMGAVVPAYNLPGVGSLILDGPTLAKIYTGEIKKWDSDEIRKLNPTAALPGEDIVVVHRSDSSGTTYCFTDYLSKVSPEWKSKFGRSKSINWPVGTGQKGSEGVAGMVQRTKGSIGYVEMTYALHNKISYASVVNAENEPIHASLESTMIAADNALKEIPDDLRFSITNAPGKGSYPISSPVWAVLYTKLPKNKGPVVVEFLRWVLHDGQGLCAKQDYAKLPSGLAERADKKLQEVKFE